MSSQDATHQEHEYHKNYGMNAMKHESHKSHDMHSDQSTDHTGHEMMFRTRFWWSLLLTVPVLL